ncbi:MAG: alpha/beta hydrolase [Bacteroidales bacterium]|jgi:pimeloyl-ACP methyl ester carboxylesterase|nr:alpha/beta hydrolase [Bacteroidales bacterium]
MIKKASTMLLILLSILAALATILVVVLLIYSPGKLKDFVDNDGVSVQGSISEKTFVTIGGIRQGMFIRSKNISNPVLLYVHGGPAFSNYFLVEKYKPGLEDHFTVCYWEQRGGGLSYSPDIPLETMTFEQLTSDCIEVTNYLRARFGNNKIYLMAHSGGTPIAIQSGIRFRYLFLPNKIE